MPAKRWSLVAAVLAFTSHLHNEAALVDDDASQYEVERRRHEDSLTNLMANMTVEVAVSMLERNPSTPPQLMALVQRTLSYGASSRRSLRAGSEQAPVQADAEAAKEAATATDKLNEMIYEVQAKYELEHLKCCDYERVKRAMIEESAQDISLYNAESAAARSGILNAQTHLQIGSSRVPKLRESLKQNTDKCNGQLKALNDQLKVVLNDIPVLSSILQMTDCGNAENKEEEQKADEVKKLLQQSRASVATRVLVEKNLLEHEQEMLALAQASERPVANSSQDVLLNNASADRLHIIRLHRAESEQNPQAQPQPAAVVAGGPCTKPQPADKNRAKCAVGPASCGKLQERFLSIQVSMVDKRDHLKDELARVGDTCKAANEALNNQIQGYTANMMAAQTSLARWTKTQNNADEQGRLKSVEKQKMEKEFKAMTETCHSNYRSFESQECGLKKIRGELSKLQNNNLLPYFQDCQLSAWAPNQCTVSCGGGTQLLRRSVVTPPKLGVKCLPLTQLQKCNTRSCPLDCKQADWSTWSGCTAECGGGIQQREREVRQRARNGGRPCGDTSDTRSCNIQSCNQDCRLNDWTEWSQCSKACGHGQQRRIRTVAVAARGTGKCPHEKQDARLQFRSCNTVNCPQNLRCRSNLDIVLVLDGAGGTGDGAWGATKAAATKLVTGLGGNGGAHVAVLAFGGPQNWGGIAACTGEGPDGLNVDTEKVCKLRWVSHLTGDVASIVRSLETLERPEGSRLTSAALGLANTEFNIGRKNTPSVVVVITHGRPLNLAKTHLMSNKLRKKARVIWVAVGPSAPVDTFRHYASNPDEENVMVVRETNHLQQQYFIDHVVASLCPQIGKAPPPAPTVTWSSPMQYAQLNALLDRDFSGRNVCGQNRHVCNYQEVTILGVGYGVDAPKNAAWIVGGFSNWEVHRRSIWNGQDSVQCKDGKYPAWWDKWGPYFGRVHCHPATETRPVACCEDVQAFSDPGLMRLSQWRGNYHDLNRILDGDYNGGAACGGGFHVCNFQEATMYGAIRGSSPHGWIVGGFSNWEQHRRSVWNGQDSVQCKAGSYPFLYPQWGPYFARVHCENAASHKPVVCCANRPVTPSRPELMRLNGRAMPYIPTLNEQLDKDWQGRATCGADWHVCNFQEVTVYMSTTGLDLGAEAWVVGGFSNLEYHRRSLWNGQDSTECQPGNFPFVYRKWAEYYGRIHCAPGGQHRQVLCCRDNGWQSLTH